MKPLKLGDPVKADVKRNCLACARFAAASCRDPKRNWRYACSLFQRLPDLDMYEKVDIEEPPVPVYTKAAVKKAKGAVKSTGKQAVAPKKHTADDRLHPSEVVQDSADPGSLSKIEAMVEEAISTGFRVTTDMRIDDRDLKQAANCYEWMTDAKFAKQQLPLFAKQVQIVLNVLGEYCPRCSREGYVEDIPYDTPFDDIWDNVQMLKYGKCPKCRVSRSELIAEGELQEFYELAAVVGQRGGKTAVSSFMESYQIHRWVKCPNPQGLFGVMAQQPLHATYVALTFNQARDLYFDVVYNILEESTWFTKYHEMLDDYGHRYGEELYAFKDTFIRYDHRKLTVAPSGPNKRTLRGKTRFSTAIDEAGWFPFGKDNEDKTKMSGEEVHKALSRSMLTIANAHHHLIRNGEDNVPKPLFLAISSPSEQNDLIMQLYKSSNGNKSITYGVHYATWEFNPLLPRNSPYIVSEFARDPEGAMRDYGAVPPLSSSPFISEVKNVVRCFANRRNVVKTKQYQFKSKTKMFMTSADVTIRDTDPALRVLCIDMGEVNNSFAFCIASLNLSEDDDGNDIEKIRIDGIGEVMPSRNAPVSFNKLYHDALLPIAEETHCRGIVCDHWQSIKMLEDLSDALNGAPWKRQRLKYEDFTALKEAIYSKLITFPELEVEAEKVMEMSTTEHFMGKPCAHLLSQILTVRDNPGRGVLKGVGRTDDLFRTVALAHWALNDPEMRELLIGEPPIDPPEAIGYLASGTGVAVVSRATRIGAISTGGRGMGSSNQLVKSASAGRAVGYLSTKK